MKNALITGITGQDGYYLAKLLLSLKYTVWGLITGQNNPKLTHTKEQLPELELVEGNLLDEASLVKAVIKSKADEIYNLGAISYVKFSFDNPTLTGNVTGLGTTRLLETIKIVNPQIKFYQASSAEMFGNAIEFPQNEDTVFNPVSPYAIAKTYAFHMTKLYREAYGIFACNGILFNHESPIRGQEFVTRKISSSVAKIALGKQKLIKLGNIDAKRDWGYAADYVEAMHSMLQCSKADDYVIATNETHSVKEFLQLAFEYAGINHWEKYVIANSNDHARPVDVKCLVGDYLKAKKAFGWQPKTTFKQLVAMVVKNDLALEKNAV